MKSARVVAPAAARFLKERPKQPFFPGVGFYETHREFPRPSGAGDPRFTAPAPTVPDTPATRADMAGYHASARVMDDGAGLVLSALERAGLAGNTLVIGTTDHGIAFPRMKCSLTYAGWGARRSCAVLGLRVAAFRMRRSRSSIFSPRSANSPESRLRPGWKAGRCCRWCAARRPGSMTRFLRK